MPIPVNASVLVYLLRCCPKQASNIDSHSHSPLCMRKNMILGSRDLSLDPKVA